MNPDQNRGGMTVQTLMMFAILVSAGVPVIAICLLALLSVNITNPTMFVATVIIIALIMVVIVFVTNWMVQNRVRARISGLADVCQDYIAGDRTVRAMVVGDDDFAKLALSLNAVIDSAAATPGSPSSVAG